MILLHKNNRWETHIFPPISSRLRYRDLYARLNPAVINSQAKVVDYISQHSRKNIDVCKLFSLNKNRIRKPRPKMLYRVFKRICFYCVIKEKKGILIMPKPPFFFEKEREKRSSVGCLSIGKIFMPTHRMDINGSCCFEVRKRKICIHCFIIYSS